MDWKVRGEELLAEYTACCRARPYHNAIDVELAKESCVKFATHLHTQLGWGTDNEIAEACHQLEPRLKKFKETVVLDILTDGTI
jgi:hypothetical protein